MKIEKLKPKVTGETHEEVAHKWLSSKVGRRPIKVQLPQKLVGPFKCSSKESLQLKVSLFEVPKKVVQSTSPEVLDPPRNLRDREVESIGPKVGAAPKCGQPTHSLLKSGYGNVRQDSKVTQNTGEVIVTIEASSNGSVTDTRCHLKQKGQVLPVPEPATS